MGVVREEERILNNFVAVRARQSTAPVMNPTAPHKMLIKCAQPSIAHIPIPIIVLLP